MSIKLAAYGIPALGTLCAAGAVAVVVSARAPLESDFAAESAEVYEARIPRNLGPDGEVPTMEQVVEKHLFVKERKATGQNTFADLLVKGVYVGEQSSAVFSLKYKPDANLRVWMGDVDSVIRNITNQRDPRMPIVTFLNEWDIKEITFEGVTFEHIITGEVETYYVDYTPSKHVADNAEAGYGQGKLAVTESGGQNAASKNASKNTQQSTARNQRAETIQQMRSMVEEMSPEQRARLAERISSGFQPSDDSQQNSTESSSKKSSDSSSSSTSSSSRSSRRSR